MAAFRAYSPNTSAATITMTWTTGSCTFMNDLVDEFSGEDLTNFVDASNSATGSGSPTASVTPVNNNDGVWGAANDSVTAVGSGYTKGADDTQQDWSEWKILSGSAGIAQTVNFTGSGTYTIFAATIKPAGAATCNQSIALMRVGCR